MLATRLKSKTKFVTRTPARRPCCIGFLAMQYNTIQYNTLYLTRVNILTFFSWWICALMLQGFSFTALAGLVSEPVVINN